MKVCIVFLALVALALAANDSGKCVLDQYKKTLSVGEVYHPIGSCQEIKCVGEKSITGKACAAFAVAPPCRVGKEDLTKPYPDCCPKSVCT